MYICTCVMNFYEFTYIKDWITSRAFKILNEM